MSARLTASSWLLIGCSVFWSVDSAVTAADWPMWRCDASRSAAGREDLPEHLHLQWIRELPPTVPAWPNEPRLWFDTAYEPIAVGKLLLVGSPNDGSVTAFDAETGAERWKFFSNGPVRFAPVAFADKVIFGSDDGFLYCVSAEEGKFLWKVRGAPEGRPERHHLGNNRLISFWPVRGGPVLAEGTLYFAAGIWPTMGVFVVAVEAETGKLVWRNGELGSVENIQWVGVAGDTGLSPQGYLVVSGDTLLVPNGRAAPAGLDRRSGKLLYYNQGRRDGDCRVTAMGDYALVGRDSALDLRSGRASGGRFAAKADARAGHELALGGCSSWSVLSEGVAYGMGEGNLTAYDLAHVKLSEYDVPWPFFAIQPKRWDVPKLWSLTMEAGGQESAAKTLTAGRFGLGYHAAEAFEATAARSVDVPAAMIRSGKRVYIHSGNTLAAVDLGSAAGGTARTAWTQPVEGSSGSMLAANGHLFVVTGQGRLTCFGAEKGAVRTFSVGAGVLPAGNAAASAAPQRTAADILRRTQVTEGYCLVLGLGSGRLLEEFLEQSKLKLIGVDTNRRKIDTIRQKLVDAGVYGKRVELFVGDALGFSFPPYLASLIVSDDAAISAGTRSLPVTSVFETLRPYGGVACLAIPAASHEALVQAAAAAKLENAEIQRIGEWTLLRRVGPLPGSADWTHETADAARTFYSKDQRVKPPLGILWYGDGDDYGFWTAGRLGPTIKAMRPQVVGGRVFGVRRDSKLAAGVLVACDAYTGRVLWKRQVDSIVGFASMDDGVYVAAGNRCHIFDPATGQEKTIYSFEAEPGHAVKVSDIRVGDEIILIATALKKVADIRKGFLDSTMLVALERRTGRQLWKRPAQEQYTSDAIALGRDKVFCVDELSPFQGDRWLGAGRPKTVSSTMLALDDRSGKVCWSATSDHMLAGGGGRFESAAAVAYCAGPNLVLAYGGRAMRAYDADSGKVAWEQPRSTGQPLIIRGNDFLNQTGRTYDLRTGRPSGKAFAMQTGKVEGENNSRVEHRGCNYVLANEYLVLLRNWSACYIDLTSGKECNLHAARTGCTNSLIAADGILNVPNLVAMSCVCNYSIQTAFAMMHMPDIAQWQQATPAKQLLDLRKPRGSL